MIDPRLLDAWSQLLRLMGNSRETLEAMQPLAGLPPEQLAALMAGATGTGAPRPGPKLQPIEQVWALLGVVPRYRYEELLERYEALRARVEEAELTIERLRKLLDRKGGETEARQVLDTWGSAVRETLRAQAQLMRSFAPLPPPPKPEAERPSRSRTARRSPGSSKP